MTTSLPSEFLILLIISLLISAIGFYRFLYFITIGYTFSIVGMALATLFIFRSSLGMLTGVQAVFLVIYGVRLGTFLVQREYKRSYRQELDNIHEENAGISIGRKVGVWLAVSLLYVQMFSPALFNFVDERVNGTAANSLGLSIGLIIIMLGLSLEAVADKQKSVFKEQSPDRFCDVGVYGLVRFPNYLGEILFWIGNWTAAIAAYQGWLSWATASIGLLGIVFVMMVSTIQLEQKQNKRYGNLQAYQRYSSRVPILIPVVPLYSLNSIGKKWRWRL